MRTDYVAKTIQAYDNNPQKYMESTKDVEYYSAPLKKEKEAKKY